jgi:hypothetical protein
VHGKIGFNAPLAEYRRPYPGLHTYAEAVHYITQTDRLSDDEKRWLLGGTVRHLLHWP